MGCVKILRSLVFLFNILFWLGGVVCLSLGLWLLLDPAASDFFSLHSAHPGSFRVVGWLLVLAGLLVSLVGCCGCCGAWKLSQPALVLFFLILVIAFCLELAAAMVAYNRQEQVRAFVEGSMYDTVRNRYGSDSNYKEAFDSIQTSFECCGVKSYTDWLGASWERKAAAVDAEEEEGFKPEHGIGAIGGRGNGYGRVPTSCCNEVGLSTYPSNCGVSFTQAPLNTYEQFLHPKGCADAVYESTNGLLNTIIAVCVAVGALQLLGIILSMCLCCCVNASSKSEYEY